MVSQELLNQAAAVAQQQQQIQASRAQISEAANQVNSFEPNIYLTPQQLKQQDINQMYQLRQAVVTRGVAKGEQQAAVQKASQEFEAQAGPAERQLADYQRQISNAIEQERDDERYRNSPEGIAEAMQASQQKREWQSYVNENYGGDYDAARKAGEEMTTKLKDLGLTPQYDTAGKLDSFYDSTKNMSYGIDLIQQFRGQGDAAKVADIMGWRTVSTQTQLPDTISFQQQRLPEYGTGWVPPTSGIAAYGDRVGFEVATAPKIVTQTTVPQSGQELNYQFTPGDQGTRMNTPVYQGQQVKAVEKYPFWTLNKETGIYEDTRPDWVRLSEPGKLIPGTLTVIPESQYYVPETGTYISPTGNTMSIGTPTQAGQQYYLDLVGLYNANNFNWQNTDAYRQQQQIEQQKINDASLLGNIPVVGNIANFAWSTLGGRETIGKSINFFTNVWTAGFTNEPISNYPSAKQEELRKLYTKRDEDIQKSTENLFSPLINSGTSAISGIGNIGRVSLVTAATIANKGILDWLEKPDVLAMRAGQEQNKKIAEKITLLTTGIEENKPSTGEVFWDTAGKSIFTGAVSAATIIPVAWASKLGASMFAQAAERTALKAAEKQAARVSAAEALGLDITREASPRLVLANLRGQALQGVGATVGQTARVVFTSQAVVQGAQVAADVGMGKYPEAVIGASAIAGGYGGFKLGTYSIEKALPYFKYATGDIAPARFESELKSRSPAQQVDIITSGKELNVYRKGPIGVEPIAPRKDFYMQTDITQRTEGIFFRYEPVIKEQRAILSPVLGETGIVPGASRLKAEYKNLRTQVTVPGFGDTSFLKMFASNLEKNAGVPPKVDIAGNVIDIKPLRKIARVLNILEPRKTLTPTFAKNVLKSYQQTPIVAESIIRGTYRPPRVQTAIRQEAIMQKATTGKLTPDIQEQLLLSKSAVSDKIRERPGYQAEEEVVIRGQRTSLATLSGEPLKKSAKLQKLIHEYEMVDPDAPGAQAAYDKIDRKILAEENRIREYVTPSISKSVRTFFGATGLSPAPTRPIVNWVPAINKGTSRLIPVLERKTPIQSIPIVGRRLQNYIDLFRSKETITKQDAYTVNQQLRLYNKFGKDLVVPIKHGGPHLSGVEKNIKMLIDLYPEYHPELIKRYGSVEKAKTQIGYAGILHDLGKTTESSKEFGTKHGPKVANVIEAGLMRNKSILPEISHAVRVHESIASENINVQVPNVGAKGKKPVWLPVKNALGMTIHEKAPSTLGANIRSIIQTGFPGRRIETIVPPKRVTPEEYLTYLQKTGKIVEFGPSSTKVSPSAIATTIFEKSGAKSVFYIPSLKTESPQTYQHTFAHELVHVKTPSILMKLERNIYKKMKEKTLFSSFRARDLPTERLAYGLESSLAKRGFTIPGKKSFELTKPLMYKPETIPGKKDLGTTGPKYIKEEAKGLHTFEDKVLATADRLELERYFGWKGIKAEKLPLSDAKTRVENYRATIAMRNLEGVPEVVTPKIQMTRPVLVDKAVLVPIGSLSEGKFKLEKSPLSLFEVQTRQSREANARLLASTERIRDERWSGTPIGVRPQPKYVPKPSDNLFGFESISKFNEWFGKGRNLAIRNAEFVEVTKPTSAIKSGIISNIGYAAKYVEPYVKSSGYYKETYSPAKYTTPKYPLPYKDTTGYPSKVTEYNLPYDEPTVDYGKPSYPTQKYPSPPSYTTPGYNPPTYNPSRYNPPNYPDYEPPRNPNPDILLFQKGKEKKKKLLKTLAYQAQVRRRGKFVNVGIPTTMSKALKTGAQKTQATLAATFRVVPTKVEIADEDFNYKVNMNVFRPPKSTRELPLTFIQRKGGVEGAGKPYGARLASYGERKEIQQARAQGKAAAPFKIKSSPSPNILKFKGAKLL